MRPVHAWHYRVIFTVNSIQSERVLKACRVTSIQEADIRTQPLLLLAQSDHAIFWRQFV